MLATSTHALKTGEKKTPKCGKGLKLSSAGWTLIFSRFKQNERFFL